MWEREGLIILPKDLKHDRPGAGANNYDNIDDNVVDDDDGDDDEDDDDENDDNDDYYGFS